jgi:hypothetical protein
MQTIRVLEKTGKDGVLSLRIPLGKPEAEYEVLVVVQPTAAATTPEERGWPPGSFEKTFGSIDIADRAARVLKKKEEQAKERH